MGTKILSRTTVFNINNKDWFLEHKIVKDHMTLKTGVLAAEKLYLHRNSLPFKMY